MNEGQEKSKYSDDDAKKTEPSGLVRIWAADMMREHLPEKRTSNKKNYSCLDLALSPV